MKLEKLITDKEIEAAFSKTDFGETPKRVVIQEMLLRCVCGFGCTGIRQIILKKLKLIALGVNNKAVLTKKGKLYLWLSLKDQLKYEYVHESEYDDDVRESMLISHNACQLAWQIIALPNDNTIKKSKYFKFLKNKFRLLDHQIKL